MGSCYSNIIPFNSRDNTGQSSNPEPTKPEVNQLNICGHSPRILKLCNSSLANTAIISKIVQQSHMSNKQVPNNKMSQELNHQEVKYHQELNKSQTILACDLTLPRQRLNWPVIRFSKMCHPQKRISQYI